MVENGNRTNRSAIYAKIIRVVTKSIDRVAGGQKRTKIRFIELIIRLNTIYWLIIRFFHDDKWQIVQFRIIKIYHYLTSEIYFVS